MKKGIHPTFYFDAEVVCACGNRWTTGSTRKSIRTEICSNCHPFYTGEQARIVDTEGQVDRFYRKLQARQSFTEQKKARDDERTSPERPMADLGLNSRTLQAFNRNGIETVGQFIDKLAEGDDALLALEGIGRKGLIDTKKSLRSMGYILPEPAVAEEESAE